MGIQFDLRKNYYTPAKYLKEMAESQQCGPETGQRHFKEDNPALFKARRKFWADNYGDYERDLENELHNLGRKRPGRLECTPIVTVLVGPFEHKFYFHHGLLCRHSLLFRHMLQSPHFTEAKENVVRLPEEDVERFAVFTKYVYVREYAGDKRDMGAILEEESYFEDEDTNDEVDLDFSQFVQMNPEQGLSDMSSAPQSDDHCGFGFLFSCYVLADMLQAPGLKRLVTDEILEHGMYCDAANLTTKHIYYAYDNTIRKDDPLRRFCIMTKFEQSSIKNKLADSELFTMVENGGPLARDIMWACGKQAVNQKQEIIESHRREVKACNTRFEGWKTGLTLKLGITG
ncbi:uncharacterized protein ASPGLDRAFT_38280 [Aspergillus glaucus CBS 516.65]|uniref:BTB domain-containing protein n=1 Tax=Aspergillus glaucus CBS 516.65 TaxID=1160497 RepID=A0A1L9VAY8_ASPGL|nr:hypothetical protein ASPGLDRAFT_38280 [Aspergillus glaucus CBS 516.65]OJJ81070.1 hypothetical protein ASPGLDRAFT_38280 [Aspergillus glaucus CBS 516.65]